MIAEGYETPTWYSATCEFCDEPIGNGDLCADCVEAINLARNTLNELLAHRRATQ